MSRKKELAVIHIAKEELGLDDEWYRDLLEAWTGETSSADLSQEQRHEVIENFKRMGFEPESDREERLEVQEDDKPQVQKIKQLWLKLHGVGAVKNPSLESLNAYVQRMTETDRVQWLGTKDAVTVIEALKGWYSRVRAE